MSEFRVVEGEEAPSLSLPGVKVVTARESDDLYVLDVESTVPTTHCLFSETRDELRPTWEQCAIDARRKLEVSA